MSVYVNRLLNFKKIKVVGFDMDYTLVGYNIEAFEGLTHSQAAHRLVEKLDYPQEVSELVFDHQRAIVGLVIDKRNGNLLKLSRFGKVKLAYHGLDEIDFRERKALYRQRAIDLRDSDFQSLDTAFAISNGVLFAQLVQLKKEGATLPDYRQMAADVNECIDGLHKDGTLKTILRADFSQYVVKDEGTARLLERLRDYGKKLMIITNSDYAYTKALLDYALNPFLEKYSCWEEVFDLVITFAEKPRFFEGKHRFLKVNPQTGTMSNHEGSVCSGIWQGGWFGGVQQGFEFEGDEFLYLGDHIYGDVVSIKKLCDWRTGLVLSGLEEELNAIENTRVLQEEIDSLMAKKEHIQHTIEEQEMMARSESGKTSRGDDALYAELEKENSKISERVEELRTYFNPYWGEIFRAGSEESHYAAQVERYACIYMTKLADLNASSPRTYFRPPRRKLAHERG